MLFAYFFVLILVYSICQMIIGGQGGRGGESSPEQWDNNGGERGFTYDTGSAGGLLPGSGGGGGAGVTGAGNLGGAGGDGGGAILLYAEEIIINGVIKVNGGNGGRGTSGANGGYGGGGGGSGGSVKLSSCTLTAGSGARVEAKGGNGGQARGTGERIRCGVVLTFLSKHLPHLKYDTYSLSFLFSHFTRLWWWWRRRRDGCFYL